MPFDTSSLNQVGIELGSGDYGTASGSFSRGMCVSAFDFGTAEQTVEPIPDIKGNFDIERVTKGMLAYNGSLAFALDVGGSTAGGIGDFLASLLGTDAGVDIGGGDFSHTFTVSKDETPPWLNLWSDKDAVQREYDGFYVTSIKFTFDSEGGSVPVEVTGIYKDQAGLNSQVLTFQNTLPILPSLITIFTLATNTLTNFKTCEITLTNTTSPFTPLQNGRTIAEAFRGDYQTTISLSGINFADETERAKFIAVTRTAFVLKATDANADYIQFTYPLCNYTTFTDPPLAGTDLKTISAELLVAGDNDDNKILLQNQYPSLYSTGAAI